MRFILECGRESLFDLFYGYKCESLCDVIHYSTCHTALNHYLMSYRHDSLFDVSYRCDSLFDVSNRTDSHLYDTLNNESCLHETSNNDLK